MADKFLALINNRQTEVEATTTSAGIANAGDIPALGSDGRLHESMMPVGVAPDVLVAPASENLDAGDFVNVWSDAGVTKVRKADASTASAGKIAHGFVLAGVTAPADATVYFEGHNTQLSGLVAGTTYALSHSSPGDVVALASATATAGHSLQILGVATSTTSMSVEISQPVIRA